MRRKTSVDKRYSKSHWSTAQKLEAASTYMMLGNLKEVALVTSVPYETLKSWKYSDWWKEACAQFHVDDVQQLDSNLRKIVNKALKATEDRLDRGDVQYDPKTGELIRIPVKASVALKISTELLTKQDKLREQPKREEMEKTIDSRLAKLSEEFARFATSKLIEGEVVKDAT